MTPKKPTSGPPNGEHEDLPEVVVPTHVIRIKQPVQSDKVAGTTDEVAADIRTAFTGRPVKDAEPQPGVTVDEELDAVPRTEVNHRGAAASPNVRIMSVPDEQAVSGILTAVTGRQAGRTEDGVMEFKDAPTPSAEVTPQSVAYHVMTMGLTSVPGVHEALDGEYASPEELADAVCAALQPFEAVGLRVPQVRALLLLPPSAQPDVLGLAVGGRDYIVLGPCGKGGIGSTFFVADVREPGKLLVLKRVQVNKMNNGHVEEEMAMVRREPDVLAVANELISADSEDDAREFTQLSVMPFHEGPSLQSLLTESPGMRLPPKVACWIALSIAQELKRVGRVWHLDLKGSNIIISPQLRAKLIDFGAGRIAPRDANSVQLGMVVQQTPAYGAPELSEGMATSKSDVYSLLLLLYQMLSGEQAVPEHVTAGATRPEQALAAARRYKVGDGKEVLSILRHLNLDDAADPKGEHRSKILQVTDWHAPGTHYADAGSRIRQIFNPGMQTSVARRPDLSTLIEQLEIACRELGVDPELGPPMNEVERDETRLVGRQVTPQAVLASIVQENSDPFLARVDRTKKKERDTAGSVSE